MIIIMISRRREADQRHAGLLLAVGVCFAACDSPSDEALATAGSGASSTSSGMTPEPPPFLPPVAKQFRAPAYPLVTHDPYFSVWSFSDELTSDWSRHWTGAINALTSMIRIDGQTFRLVGPDQAAP